MKRRAIVAVALFVGQPVVAGPSLVVVDAHGKTVGPYDSRGSEYGESYVVIETRDPMVLSVRFTNAGGFLVGPMTYAYTTSDCTGDRYVYVPAQRELMHAQIEQFPRGAAFVIPQLGKAATLSIASVKYSGQPCRTFQPPRQSLVAPPRNIPADRYQFTPPFTVRIQP